jgi:hypothetical protein
VDNKFIYQNFRLVTSNNNLLKYFIDDQYNGFHELNEKMEDYYIGDGENILFREKIIYNNLIVVKFEILNNIKFDIEEKSFDVTTNIPYNNGCLSCDYFVPKDRICKYYREMGIKIKNNCVDFKQRRENDG